VTDRQPYRYEPTATAASVREAHPDLPPGTETDDEVVVAGRLMLRRVQGKLAFGTSQDATPDFEGFCARSLGDWLGVRGRVMTTRRGELSVAVDEWVVLAGTRRPFPDKWHGITDPDTRFRQRYVDLWVSVDEAAALRARSRIVSLTRRWLEDRGFVEVETPTFHPIAGGAAAKPSTRRTPTTRT
jgi:lysyl-tRNA synthetase, class II